MRARRRGQSDEADVNMTPMLDIVFILLIFFIVTAVFLNEDGLEMIGPPPTEDPPIVDPNTATIIVSVNSRDQVFVNGRSVVESAVRAEIEKQISELGPSVVAVQGHRESNQGLMVRVYDQARLAKPRDVLLQDPDGEQ